MRRYHALDAIRGITLISMILYHATWDLVYMFGQNWTWYDREPGYVWQQSICWVFILLSGFCWSFGRKKWKRGMLIFCGGVLITVVTLLLMPENRVVFGVLTLISSCMLLMIPLDKWLKKCNPYIGCCVSFLLFFLFRNVNDGYLGFEKWNILKISSSMYRNLFTTYLGFPEPGFFSTDYFSILPWLFLFVAGYFLYYVALRQNMLKIFEHNVSKPLQWIGRHSFEIYLVHQPVLYAGLSLFFFIM